jgi:hypothetical protein
MPMITKGATPRVGDLARTMAATPRPIVFRGVSTGRELLQHYFATLEECATVNGCALCRRELEKARRDLELAVPRPTSPELSDLAEGSQT